MARTTDIDPAYDAIIVGGGHNGLVCGAYLAKAGLNVLILERRHIVGGAATTEELFPGFSFSVCAYIVYVLQDKVVRELELKRHGYEVQPLAVKRFFPFPDGRSISYLYDLETTCRELEEKFSARDAEGYRKWQEFWQRVAVLFNRYFLTEPPTIEELKDSVKGTSEEPLLDRLLNGTLSDLLDEFFDSDEVKASAISHVVDMNGIDIPGAMFSYATTKPSALHKPEHQGIAIGGMGGLTQAMARSAQSFGAKIRCGAEVKRILVEDEKACGVELTDGQIIRSRMVVSNADPKRTFLNLLDGDHLPETTQKEVSALSTRCVTLKFHAAVSELPDLTRFLGSDPDPRRLAEISICPSLEFYRKSLADANAGHITDCPIIDVQIPTVYDPSLAPPGQHCVSMWVRFAPVTPKEGDWSELRKKVGEQVIDYFTRFAPNFKDSIIDWLIYTPQDLAERVYMTDGNFRHTDHNVQQLFANRLFGNGGYRTPVDQLYMCGSGTHPGGDVSGAPGHNSAHAILKDLGLAGS